MQVAFRCKRSGNIVKFSLEGDIASLRKHEGYEEVKEAEQPVVEPVQVEAPKKKMGRPRKNW